MRLYHFLPEEYALEDLKEKRLKVSIINDLNDPFEFQAGFKRPTSALKTEFGKFKKGISKEFGLLCFSKNWHNPLLWSHYANKHTGIALGFDLPDIKATEVTYSKERPLFQSKSLSASADRTSFLDKLIKTKFSSWSYEEEVRFFFQLNTLISENGFYFDPFDHELILKEVIVGCNSQLTDSYLLTALKEFTGITLIRSRMAFKSFKVVRNKQKIFKI